MKARLRVSPRNPLENEFVNLLLQLNQEERRAFTRRALIWPRTRRRWWARDDERGLRPLR